MLAKTLVFLAVFASSALVSAATVRGHVTHTIHRAEVVTRPGMEALTEVQPELERPPERGQVPIMNSGYISGFFPGSFVTGLRGEGQSIGYFRPTGSVGSPGRIYDAGLNVMAPERVVGLRLGSPGSEHRGQAIRETMGATSPRVEFTVMRGRELRPRRLADEWERQMGLGIPFGIGM